MKNNDPGCLGYIGGSKNIPKTPPREVSGRLEYNHRLTRAHGHRRWLEIPQAEVQCGRRTGAVREPQSTGGLGDSILIGKNRLDHDVYPKYIHSWWIF